MIQTIREAAELLRTKQISPLDLVRQCFAQMDRCESQVRAWVLVEREEAMRQARLCEAEIQSGQWRGPMHGIPIGVKDIFDVYDWPTAGGSKRWQHAIARSDAPSVAAMRQAGAILLGKTVTTHFASFDPPITRNPWNLNRTPGGSSSGSAAATSTLMCFAAFSSQTGGSITRPASYCGTCGHKPSFDRVSAQGVMPLAASMDHVGPVARSVEDLWHMIRAMSAKLPSALTPKGNPRLGMLRGMFHELASPVVRDMMSSVESRLRAAGAEVVEVPLPAAFDRVLVDHRIVMAGEALDFHRERLRRHPEDYLPNFRQLLAEGEACSTDRFQQAKQLQAELSQQMREMSSAWDALLTPATTSAAPPADTTGNPAFNSPWSFVGAPTISFPTGHFDEGLPLGLQIVGRRDHDDSLFPVALWCEQVLGSTPLTPAIAQ